MSDSKSSIEESASDIQTMPLARLCDHIEASHHAFVQKEIPRISALAERVANVHGSEDPRLIEVQHIFAALAEDLLGHLMKEEQILFPMIRELESVAQTPRFHCGSVSNPIRQMIFEHEEADSALQRLKELTDNHTPPEWACGTYRALLRALAAFELDLYEHMHKENHGLFPRSVQMEGEKNL